MTTAIALSGGGARGAYEVGVLSYLLKHVRYGSIDVITGTSVGAINGTFLGSVLDDPEHGMDRMAHLWHTLEVSSVLNFGVLQAARLPRMLMGGKSGTGFFNTTPLEHLINDGIVWPRLHRNIQNGKLKAISVAATHAPTGRPWCFIERTPGLELRTATPLLTIKEARILPEHVMASAALPILFPPINVEGELFVDGGLRLNTPLAPALYLGGTRIFVISNTSSFSSTPKRALNPGEYPGTVFLLGKILNAFLLDHVNDDLEELRRINKILEDGTLAYGSGFVHEINKQCKARGENERKIVEVFSIHPTTDLGTLANQHIKRHRSRLSKSFGRVFTHLLDVGTGNDSDLASYLLFDGLFAKELIQLGFDDAKARHAEIEDFMQTGRSIRPPRTGLAP